MEYVHIVGHIKDNISNPLEISGHIGPNYSDNLRVFIAQTCNYTILSFEKPSRFIVLSY